MNSSYLAVSALGCSCGGNEAGPYRSCSSSSGVFLLKPAKKNNAPKSVIPPTTEPTAIPAFAPELSPELDRLDLVGIAEAVGDMLVDNLIDAEFTSVAIRQLFYALGDLVLESQKNVR